MNLTEKEYDQEILTASRDDLKKQMNKIEKNLKKKETTVQEYEEKIDEKQSEATENTILSM